MTVSLRVTALACVAVPIALAVPALAQNAWRAGQAPDAPIRTTELPPSGAAPASEIADRYLERARTDRANADLWIHCAAAALKRGTVGEADADAYARGVAAIVKPSMHRGAGSPCEDAIPARIWDGDAALAVADTEGEASAIGTLPPVASRPAGGGVLVPPEDAVAAPDPGALTPAEEERMRRINAAADAQDRARVEAQAAASQRRQDTQARYDRERAQYEADVAAAKAADADYQRRLEERRRLIESGQYQTPR